MDSYVCWFRGLRAVKSHRPSGTRPWHQRFGVSLCGCAHATGLGGAPIYPGARLRETAIVAALPDGLASLGIGILSPHTLCCLPAVRLAKRISAIECMLLLVGGSHVFEFNGWEEALHNCGGGVGRGRGGLERGMGERVPSERRTPFGDQ